MLHLMIGDKVPQENEEWEVFLKLMRAVEYIFAPTLHRGHIGVMDDLINEYLTARTEFFPNVVLQPIEHFMRHYATQTRKFGPLVHCWTMKFEAKRQYFTTISKLNKCRKNICLTLAKRHQMDQELYPVEQNLLQKNIEILH